MALEAQLVAALRAARMTFACAESCTGGLVAERVTRVEGASAAFGGGVVAYSDAAKADLLGVERALLREKGAVSREVAREMAMRARALLAADVAVSATGLAGPGPEAGLVFLGVAHWGGVEVHEMRYGGGREAVRQAAAEDALRFALEAIPRAKAALGEP